MVSYNVLSSKRALRIHCFGASVTRQAIDHATGEYTGYAPKLKNFLEEDFPDLEFIVTSAGSSHFDTAGYCLLPEVLKSNPDILIIDWHTTGLGEFNNQLWLAAIQQIKQAGIPTLIALFPRRDTFQNETERPNVKQARDIAGGCIRLLDSTAFVGFNPEIHLRDVVHTTPVGAVFYAQLLTKTINEMLGANDKLPFQDYSESDGPQPLVEVPSVSQYIMGDDFIPCVNIHVEFERDRTIETPCLILDHEIGPFSPVVEISLDGVHELLISLWDPWCYWTRQNYTELPIYGCTLARHGISFLATDNSPDYQKSRDLDFDFTPYSDRYMSIRSIYSIGGEILSLRYDPL